MLRSMTGAGKGIVLALTTAGAMALMAGVAYTATTTVTGDAAHGKQLFESHCAVCHKKDASGGINLGDTTSADLQSPALEEQYHQNDQLIKRAMLDGIDEEGEQLDSVMPRWGKKGLTDQDANDIIAFLHTVKTTK